MRGRVTMLGISRWSEGYSYKTIERFFDKKINWLSLKWQLIRRNLNKEVILVADETTVSKSGKSTYGVDYFYSGIHNRAIRGVSFLSFALVDVKTRKCYPLFTRQMHKIKKQVDQKDIEPKVKRGVGRPKGSKNRNSGDTPLKGTFKVVSRYLVHIKKVIKLPNLRYFVYDGAFGNGVGVQAVKPSGFYLISKLKRNSKLFFPFNGEQKSRGRKRIYGEVVDYENIDDKYLKETKQEENKEIKIYQFEALNKSIKGKLNIVIIIERNTHNNKSSRTILFSTDLDQHYQKIRDYYSLRFQIEFNFRDAKQFFGLEDFMNITKRRIHNFANLSMFMNSVTHLIHKDSHYTNYSINDIKALFMAERYTKEVLKIYGHKVDEVLIDEAIYKVSAFSLIHGDVA